MIYQILLVSYLLVAIILVGIVLIQESKDGGMGGLGGGSASNTVFGSSGSGNFITRLTTIIAIVFFGLCLLIGNINTKSFRAQGISGFEDLSKDAQSLQQKVEEAPKQPDIPDLPK